MELDKQKLIERREKLRKQLTELQSQPIPPGGRMGCEGEDDEMNMARDKIISDIRGIKLILECELIEGLGGFGGSAGVTIKQIK